MTQKAVIYCRVSGRKQTKDGSGLNSQEHRCRQYAEAKGYEVEAVFPDDVSGGGDFMKRKGMVALLGYLDAHSDTNYVVIFDDLKRYARDVEFHLKLARMMQERGAARECLNFRFEDSPEGKLNETVTAAAGAYERESMARQNRQKSIARLEQGFAVQSIPPVGYRYNRSSVGGQVLERDEPNASIVQEALEGYATGRFASHVEVRRFLETHPQFPKAENGKIHKMFVIRMLRQCLYAGFVESKAFGVSIRKGKHSGLISADTYERILNRLDQKAYAPTRKDIKQDFPLRGAVCCSECNTILTAGWCKGKRQKYPYYFCRKKGCSQYGRMIRRDVIEREFTELLADLKPSRGVVRSAARMFADLWEHQAGQAKAVADSLNGEIRNIEGKIDQLVENTLHVSKGRVLGAIEARIDQLEREKLILQEKAANSGRPIKSFEEMFEHSMSFLTNPCKLWDSGCFDLQRTVLKLVFSEPIKYRRKEGFRTPQTALPFQLLNQISHSTEP